MSGPTTPPPSLTDLAHEACFLAGMVEGLDVLFDQADADDRQSIVTRRARNSFRPMLEAVIRHAAELSSRIDLLADHATLMDVRPPDAV